MTVYFTSDLHLGHQKIADIRGHTTSEAHTNAILDTLCTLPRGSQLWILGDLSSGSRGAEDYALAMLTSVANEGIELHLIAGNHDSVHPMYRDAHKHQRRFLEVFTSVQPFARRRIAGRPVLLSHFPYRGDHTDDDRHTQYRLRDNGRWLLHGHTHSTEQGPPVFEVPRPHRPGPAIRFPAHPQIHVGWDAWHRPVHLDELAAIIEGASSL